MCVRTDDRSLAGTDAQVWVALMGEKDGKPAVSNFRRLYTEDGDMEVGDKNCYNTKLSDVGTVRGS